MIRKWMIRLLLGLGAIVLVIVILIGIIAVDNWRQNNYKSKIQTLEVLDYNTQFVLLTDISGFDDPAWYVYQLPLGSSPTKEMKAGHNQEGVLFWNYSEGGEHYENPNIKILKGKYLVFSRGGLYHSLYDLDKRYVFVNEVSPWDSFHGSEQFSLYGDQPPPGSTGSGMDEWVRMNLHKKIAGIIAGTP